MSNQEREKSAQLKVGKKDDSLIFIRNTNTVRIFHTHDFFSIQDASIQITWSQFKTDVFYNYVNEREEILDAARREKTIIKLMEKAWTQLKGESRVVTYDMMKQRLQSFDHGLDPSFFTQEFWIQKGDQEIKDLKKFEEEDANMKMTRAETRAMIKLLLNEQRLIEHKEEEVQLGSAAIQTERAEVSRNRRSSLSSNKDILLEESKLAGDREESVSHLDSKVGDTDDEGNRGG